MKITVDYRHRFITKYNRYIRIPVVQETDFNLDSINLYNYEIVDTVEIETPPGKSKTIYTIELIKDRYIPIAANKCRVDYSDFDRFDQLSAERVILKSSTLIKRGLKKRGFILREDAWKTDHLVRNKISKPLLKATIETFFEYDGYKIINYCQSYKIPVPIVKVIKSVYVDGVLVGSFVNQELDEDILPKRPFPCYPRHPQRPYSPRRKYLYKQYKSEYRKKGYPRRVSSRMAMAKTMEELGIAERDYYADVERYETEMAKATAKYQNELKSWENKLKKMAICS